MPSEKWIMWNFTVKEIQMVNKAWPSDEKCSILIKKFQWQVFFFTHQMGRNYCLIRGIGNGRETGNSHTLGGNVNHSKVSGGNLA